MGGFAVNYDANGLVPAILIDDADGEVLMMAWMNAEALARTLATGLATFWSRSRGEMWVKGATSGHYMHVVDVRADCDADTLLLRVRPNGAACHTGARSCFFREVSGAATDAVVTGAVVTGAAAAADADYHMHTTWSDGAASVRAMVEAAAAAGLARVGISDHSHTPFDAGYCMAVADYAAYQVEVRAVAAEFAERVSVLCGIEQDYFGAWRGEGFDYAVGSVHYVRVGGEGAMGAGVGGAAAGAGGGDAAGADAVPGIVAGTVVSADNPMGEYLPVDMSPEVLRLGIDTHFGGDAYAYAEAYYALVADVVRQTGCSIIGHFDLVKIFNGVAADGTPAQVFFDEHHPRYVAAWQRAADALLATGVPFEINVNGVARGRCAEVYPSADIIAYLRERGARFVYSSDAHAPHYLRRHDRREEFAGLPPEAAQQ